MEIILLDNGLSRRSQHSYHLLLKVGQILSQRAILHRIFGAKRMQREVAADIGAHPHFRCSLYRGSLPPLVELLPRASAYLGAFLRKDPVFYSEQATWHRHNEIYAQDLARLPSDVWRRENLVVLPAVSQNELHGLIRHLLSLPRQDLPKVVCQLMFTPNWTPWNRNGVLGADFYRKAFQLGEALTGQKLFFTTENEALAEVYRRDFGIKTRLLPVPFGIARSPEAAGDVIRLGFFGYSKTEKGFHLLPEAIALCQARGLPVTFVVQIQHDHWEKETIAAERRLRRLPGIELIEGTMDSMAYAQKTNAVDVTLLPYDPERFGPRGSGLFTEAVAAGRPIIAAGGIFAATCIECGEAEGEIFAPYDSTSLADAIERLLPRLAACRARAAQQAEAFARRHSGEAYVDALMSFAPN